MREWCAILAFQTKLPPHKEPRMREGYANFVFLAKLPPPPLRSLECERGA